MTLSKLNRLMNLASANGHYEVTNVTRVSTGVYRYFNLGIQYEADLNQWGVSEVNFEKDN